MDSELLSLKWKNHKTSFLDILKVLRNKASHADATLACEGKFYKVHKVVLSVCSNYFDEIFEITTCKNPVIILKDVSSKNLEFLLDYMYLGEVNVKQTELSVLIKAAECLKIKGLAVPDEQIIHNESNKNQLLFEDDPPPKRRKKMHSQVLSKNENHEDNSPISILVDPIIVDVKNEPNDTEENIQSQENDLTEKYEETFSIEKEEFVYDSFQNNPGSSGVGNDPEETWKDYSFDDELNSTSLDPIQNDTNVILEKGLIISNETLQTIDPIDISSKTGKTLYKCPMCQYITRKRYNYDRHTRTHTGEKLFTCTICNHQTSDRTGLKYHSLMMHNIQLR